MQRIFNQFTFVFFILCGFNSFSQENELKILVDKIEKINSIQTAEKIAKESEKIAILYPENWHSQYYAAFTYIELANFSAKKNKDKWCDIAEKYLNKAMKIRKNDSENYVLKAYLLSVRIKVNPMFRGASMGKEGKEFLELAIKNNSNNPRAYYVRGMGIFNTPSIFG